jgi:hypothetical protein
MRLLERGDFVAQVAVTPWKRAEPGKHIGADEFKKLVTELPGWEVEELVEASEIPTDPGRWVYRVTARGSLDGLKVVQTFFAVAGPNGDQAFLTFTTKPDKAGKVGTRDVSLVNSVEFPARK